MDTGSDLLEDWKWKKTYVYQHTDAREREGTERERE